MQIKGLFKKNIHKNKINNLDSSNINVPDGLYTKCPVCSKIILTEDMYLNNHMIGLRGIIDAYEAGCQNKDIHGSG